MGALDLILLLGQAAAPQGVEVIVWVLGGLVALWVGLKLFKAVTGILARLIWVVALVVAVAWVVWALAGR